MRLSTSFSIEMVVRRLCSSWLGDQGDEALSEGCEVYISFSRTKQLQVDRHQ
jgi:hypothetical protein